MRKQCDDKIYKAAQQLEIKLAGTQEDKEQLDRLFNYILCYPQLDAAQLHHRANNIGTNDLLVRQKKIQEDVRGKDISNLAACPCCGILIQNQVLPYCTDLKQLNLGVAVHLFFKNYFFHSIVFLLMFLIYSIFSLVTNIVAFNKKNGTNILCMTQISKTGCGLSPIGAGSKILNQSQDINKYSQIQSWLGVALVSLWGLLYIFKTHTQTKFVIDMDSKRVSAPDFTLMLTNIPRSYLTKKKIQATQNKKLITQKAKKNSFQDGMLSQEQIKDKFNKQLMDYGRRINSLYSYEVIKVNVAKPLYLRKQSEIQNNEKMEKELNKKLGVFRKFVQQRKNSVQFKTPYIKRNQMYEQYMNFFLDWSQKYKSKQIKLSENNVVFVTLRSSQARRQIQTRNTPPSIGNFWNLCKNDDFPIKGVKVRKAPHPEQIKWNCIGFPLYKKRFRRLCMWLFTILLIGCSLGINIGIAYFNIDQIDIWVSIGVSIIVTFINIGIQLVIVHTSYFENQYVSSRQQSNIALKIGFGQLVNSIGIPIVVTLISKVISTMPQKSWLKTGGLVDDVFFIGAINVIVPIGYFFDPWQLYLRFWRWWYSKPSRRLNIHGQSKFNKYFGNYKFDMGYEYAYLIKTSIFTSFFTPMQPIIAVFAPIGLAIYYLVTKRNMLNHYQRPNYHFPSINNSVDFILLFNLLAFGFGSLLVNNFVGQQFQYQQNGTLFTNWIIVMIAVGFLLIVPLRIFYCCIKKPELAQLDFYQKRMLLNTDYDRLNPQTKQAAISQFKQYLEELQKKQQLPDEAYLIRVTVFNQQQVQEKQKNNNQMLASKLTQSIKGQSENGQPQYNKNLQDYKNIAKQLGSPGETPDSAEACNSRNKL